MKKISIIGQQRRDFHGPRLVVGYQRVPHLKGGDGPAALAAPSLV